jgi:hypothetical protein
MSSRTQSLNPALWHAACFGPKSGHLPGLSLGGNA